MPRNVNSLGQKWNDAAVAALADAKRAYADALPGLASKIIAAKARAKTAFSAALDAPSYDASVRAGLAPGYADVAYNERADQIAMTGFTASQKQKIVDDALVRRHLSSIIDSIVAAADGSRGNLKFVDGLSAKFKRIIINSALMKYIDNFTTSTTSSQAVGILTQNIASIDDLTLGD